MICPDCGKEYNERQKFCIICGIELVVNDMEDSNENIPDTDEFSEITESIIINEHNIENPVNTDVTEHEIETRRQIQVIYNDSIQEDFYTDDAQYYNSLNRKQEINTIPITVRTSSSEPIGKRIIRISVSFCSAMLIFAFIFLAAGSYAGRKITDTEKINRFVSTADLLSIPASEIITTENYDATPETSLLDAIYQMSDGLGISKEDIRLIYENSTIKDFLAKNLSDYAVYIRTGKQPEKLTPDILKQVYSENLNLINNTIGIKLNENDIEFAFNEIEKSEPVLEAISVKNIESSSLGGWLAPLRVYISIPAIITEAIFIVILIILISVINKKIELTLKWCGIPVLAAGICVMIITYLFSINIISINTESGLMRNITGSISPIISVDLYMASGVLAIIGFLLLIISNVITSLKNKN